jgi:hypothetical protein
MSNSGKITGFFVTFIVASIIVFLLIYGSLSVLSGFWNGYIANNDGYCDCDGCRNDSQYELVTIIGNSSETRQNEYCFSHAVIVAKYENMSRTEMPAAIASELDRRSWSEPVVLPAIQKNIFDNIRDSRLFLVVGTLTIGLIITLVYSLLNLLIKR